VDNLVSPKGCNVVVSFGEKYERNTLAYVLVCNLIMRRLYERYTQLRERPAARLVVFVEEAHRFMGPETYEYTPFGTVARELRKRGVLLCVIDQRPSQIHSDVLAMLWNRFVMMLRDPRDIDAALMGLRAKAELKPVIETLERGEVLVFGEAIATPAVLKVVEYTQFMTELCRLIGIEEPAPPEPPPVDEEW